MRHISDKIVVFTIVISVFLFLLLTKTVVSGFHFVDDHEIIKIKNELQSSGLADVAAKWVKEDMFNNTRFRPVYYIIRVFETKLFGSDFVLWSIFNGLLCCFALAFSYSGMRNLKFSAAESVLFVIITYVGPQSSVWWRLGPVESLGMAFLSLSFYFVSKSLNRRIHLTNDLLFILFLILASLTKESFIIIIPAFVFFKLWIEKETIWLSVRESVLKNLLLIVPLIVMLVELYVIWKFVGTGYSGLESNLSDNFSAIVSTSFRLIKTYLNLVLALLLIAGIALYFKKPPGRLNTLSVIFFILIIVPNIILYSKTGLAERYLLPVSFGLGFLVVTFIHGIDINAVIQKRISITLLFVSFFPFMLKSTQEAVGFSKEGLATERLLSAIPLENYLAGPVLLIADPVQSYEYSVSLKTYLLYEKKIDLYGYSQLKSEKREDELQYVEGWKSYFHTKLYSDLTIKPDMLIFLDDQLVGPFFQSSGVNRPDYLPVETGDSQYALFKKVTP